MPLRRTAITVVLTGKFSIIESVGGIRGNSQGTSQPCPTVRWMLARTASAWPGLGAGVQIGCMAEHPLQPCAGSWASHFGQRCTGGPLRAEQLRVMTLAPRAEHGLLPGNGEITTRHRVADTPLATDPPVDQSSIQPVPPQLPLHQQQLSQQPPPPSRHFSKGFRPLELHPHSRPHHGRRPPPTTLCNLVSTLPESRSCCLLNAPAP